MALKRGVAHDIYFTLRERTSVDIETSANDMMEKEWWKPVTTAVNGDFTKYLSKDGGVPATVAGTVSHVGDGIYKLPLSADEMDAMMLILYITCSLTVANGDAVTVSTHVIENPIVIYTDPNWDDKVFGPGFASGTDSLAGLRLGITNAQIAIVRDD